MFIKASLSTWTRSFVSWEQAAAGQKHPSQPLVGQAGAGGRGCNSRRSQNLRGECSPHRWLRLWPTAAPTTPCLGKYSHPRVASDRRTRAWKWAVNYIVAFNTVQKLTKDYLQGDHGLWVQWDRILAMRAMWRAGRLNPRKAPCSAEGWQMGRNTVWASRGRWVCTGQDGARRCCCLGRRGAAWFSPLSDASWWVGLCFSWLFFHVAKFLSSTGAAWEAAAAGTRL